LLHNRPYSPHLKATLLVYFTAATRNTMISPYVHTP
jgi:hypothetical protein